MIVFTLVLQRRELLPALQGALLMAEHPQCSLISDMRMRHRVLCM